MHPLLGSLAGLTDEELHHKLNELSKRMNQAYRYGNGQLSMQLQMVMEDYSAEVSRRNAKKMQELQEKLDTKTKKEGGKGLKGIIDIQ